MTTITRFDTTTRPATDDADEREVVRFFEKRKLIGEMDTDEILRDDWEAVLADLIAANPTTVEEAIAFLEDEGADDIDEADEGDEDEGGSVVPEKYRVIYGAAQNCGDEIALELTAFVTLERATKKNPDGGLDRAKLRGVAEANGIGDKLGAWEDRGLNGGLLRMNTSNVLRGMNRRGEEVRIGDRVWPADPSKLEARKEARKAAKKAKKG